VTAEARAGIEGHEAERFCGGAIDNFENIEIHAQAELLQFVHQRDIHAAKNIFEQFHHLGGARGADRNYFRNDLGVEAGGCASAWGIHATHYFGDLRETELLVTRIFTLRGEGEIKIGRDVFGAFAVRDGAAQSAFFENRQHQLFGRSRIGGAFENDELIALQVGCDGASGVFDVTEIGFAPLVERRGDADEDCVHFAKAGEIGGRIEMLCVHVSFDFFGRNVLDVGLAGVQLFNFGLIEVESGDALADVGKPECEWKSHVPAADDSDLDALIRKELRFTVHP
jgi:hypothetical protein